MDSRRKPHEKPFKRLIDLLNRDADAAALFDRMQAELAERLRKLGSVGNIAFLAGQWSMQIQREKGLRVRRDNRDTVNSLPAHLMALGDKIFRVRRCAVCGRWLFAVRDSQRVCSAVCRYKKFEQGEAHEGRMALKRFNYQMNHSGKWANVPKSERPKFPQWLKYGEPSPTAWQAIKKGHKL